MPRKIGLEKQPQKLVIFFHFLSLLPWLICAQQRQEVYFEEGGYRVPIEITNKHTPVMSREHKLIIPIPKNMPGAVSFITPEGHPITDWEKNVVEGSGIVFRNHADQTWQGARANGKEVIIVNKPSQQQAMEMQTLMDKMGAKGPMSQSDIHKVLEHGHKIGLSDRYNSDWDYVKDKLEKENGNLYRRNGELNNAVYVPGAGHFQGPAGSPQIFKNGAVIVHDQKNAARLVQPHIFEQTYSHANGSPLKVGELSQMAHPSAVANADANKESISGKIKKKENKEKKNVELIKNDDGDMKKNDEPLKNVNVGKKKIRNKSSAKLMKKPSEKRGGG